LFLGIAAEEIEAGTLLDGAATLRLKSVNGPGHFSVWSSNLGGPSVHMATSDGITENDMVSIPEGGHSHFNYAFTAMGHYEITFQAVATLIDGEKVISDDVTYYFQVGNTVRSVDTQNGLDQRSYIRNVDLAFENEDSLFGLMAPGRIELTKYDLNGENGAVLARPTMGVIGNIVRFDFGPQGLGGNRNTNAGDGYYRIGLDLDGDGQMDSYKHFYRLLGDVTGDRKVDSQDSTFLLDSLGSNNPNADANGDRSTNAVDTIVTSRALGRKLKDGLRIDD